MTTTDSLASSTLEAQQDVASALKNTPEIPLEIFSVIFSHLPSSTLSTCCRLDKHTHATALDALYWYIAPTPQNIVQIASRLLQPLHEASSVISRSRPGTERKETELLAAKVHSFVLENTPAIAFQKHISTLNVLLPKMKRLTALVLELSPASGPELFPALTGSLTGSPEDTRNDSPFRLKSFRCSLFYEVSLHNFLQTQPNITHLILRGIITRLPIAGLTDTATFLPNLQYVQAHWKIVGALVPGRPVSRLIAWAFAPQPDSDDSDQDDGVANDNRSKFNLPNIENITVSCLSSSTAKRGVDNVFMNWPLLLATSGFNGKKLQDALPRLSRLSIELSTSEQMFIEGVTAYFTQYLPTAKRLHHIFLRFNYRHTSTKDDHISDMVSVLFNSSKRLKSVVVTFPRLRTRYMRERGAKEWSNQSWDVLEDK